MPFAILRAGRKGMLRRIPFTPLVCLVIFLSIVALSASAASAKDESSVAPQNLQPVVAKAPAAHHNTPKHAVKGWMQPPLFQCLPPSPQAILKVKPGKMVAGTFAVQPFDPGVILPAPQMRQWEMSFQVFFANMSGYIGWPRFSNYYWGWLGNTENRTDLNSGLQLPIYAAWPQFTARYYFRPNWALRYSVLWNQLNGGGWPNDYILFGPNWYGWGFFWGQSIQTNMQHAYHRVGLVYDAIRTCRAKVGVFADWVHTDTKITTGCNNCGWGTTRTWSNSVNAAIAGLEVQRAFKTARNGATLSWDCKAGGIFLDDTVGGDFEAGARYSIPLNCGRSGYVKGGYRLVDLKKTQYDFVFKNTLSGGFIEGGLIF